MWPPALCTYSVGVPKPHKVHKLLPNQRHVDEDKSDAVGEVIPIPEMFGTKSSKIVLE